MKKISKKTWLIGGGIFAILLLLCIITSVGIWYITKELNKAREKENEEPNIVHTQDVTFKQFANSEEFNQYIANSQQDYGYWGFAMGMGAQIEMDMVKEERISNSDSEAIGYGAEPERHSNTNVREKNIDEPDIIKTDGKSIYIGNNQSNDRYWLYEEDINPSTNEQHGIILAVNGDNLSQDSTFTPPGDLLIQNDLLLIFQKDSKYGYKDYYQKIYAYDKNNPSNTKWTFVTDNGVITEARYINQQILLVIQNNVEENTPCIIDTIESTKSVDIACTDIYYPDINTQVDSVYTIVMLNPETGEITDTISFVGDANNSIVYVSPNNIYITFSKYTLFFDITYNAIMENKDLFPDWFIEKVEKLQDYDISSGAKLTELGYLVGQLQNSMTDDEQMKFENEMDDRMEEYMNKHAREFSQTVITKVNTQNLNIQATGSVSGILLNSFSIDEYNNYIRVATTSDAWMSDQSTNDLYILDKDLNITGKLLNLGKGERIYAVRMYGNIAYLVTYRQIDPFYVLDLSDPSNPTKVGELKIPGYSSYLHQISDTLVLGIGRDDNWKVKATLFDISDLSSPKEIDTYSINAHWSDVLDNYKAFLLDTKHQAFFIPSSNGGYVFSYENNRLELKYTVSTEAIRALYINDHMYIISYSNNKIKVTVINENTWEKIETYEF